MKFLGLLAALPCAAYGAYSAPTEGTFGDGATAATVNLAFPSNCDAGDLIVAWLSTRSSETVSTPAGYTLANAASVNRNSIFIKEAVGNEDGGNLSITITAPTEDRYAGQVACFPTGETSYDEAALIDASNSAFTADGSADIPTPTLTVALDASLIITAGFKRTENISWTVMPTSHTEIHQGGTADFSHEAVWARWIQTTKSNILVSSFVTASGATDQSRSVVVAIQAPAAVGGTGVFDVTPSVTAESTSAYTVTGSLDGSGDAWAVACIKDQTAPTGSQIAAGDCTGDVNAKAADDDSPSTGNFDFSLTLAPSDSPDFPLYDIYVWDGTTIVTLVDQYLDPPATCGLDSDEQCQFIALTSVGAGSKCVEFNNVANPDIAAPDHLVAAVTTDQEIPVSIDEACHFDYFGGPERNIVWNIKIYDASVGGYHAEDMDPIFNNDVPNCPDDTKVLVVGVAYSRDMNLDCADEDDAVLAITSAGSLPTGISHSDPTTSGTPTISGESEVAMYTALDEPGDSDGFEVTHTVFSSATATVLSCLRRTFAACETLYDSTFGAALTVVGISSCPSPVYAGAGIWSQSPAPGVIVDISTSVTMTYCP